jgi:hypothetical protein
MVPEDLFYGFVKLCKLYFCGGIYRMMMMP